MARNSKRWGLLGQLGQLDFLGLFGGKEEEPNLHKPAAREADLQKTQKGATNQASAGQTAPPAEALEHDRGAPGPAETPGSEHQATGRSDGSTYRPNPLTEPTVEPQSNEAPLDGVLEGEDHAGMQYKGLALKHWKEWRPKAYRQMQEDGTLNEAAQTASWEAARQVAELMEAGYQKHEAEEVVLREIILLPPET